MNARVDAARILSRVLDDGAYSNVLLARTEGLEAEELARRAALVYGVLRTVPFLDRVLERAGGRAMSSLDAEVRATLRVGAYELAVVGAAPYGVVDSCVEVVRALGVPRAAGLVNAVLRKVSRAGDPPPEPGTTLPSWIVTRLAAQRGAEDTHRFAVACDTPPRIGVRHRRATEETELGIPGATYVDTVAGLEEGAFDVIDPSSTAVAAAVGAEPGMRVLDIGAAPGGKTASLWDAMAGDGSLVALDKSPPRLRRMERRMERLGVGAAFVAADGRRPPLRPASFDRVLLDAPCTGLGTLRRRPEIRHRIAEDDPAALGVLQRELLDAALGLVRPGGRLVYSVCTLFAEETTAVVAGSGAVPPAGLPGEVSGSGLLLAPHLTGTDGMFIAVVEV